MADTPAGSTEARPDDEGLWLNEEAFSRANIYFFGLFGLLIIWSGKVQLWIKRDDVIGLAQTTAAMAAISLAIVTILQDKRSRERYARAALWLITLVFVVATCSGWFDVLTRNPSSENVEPFALHFTIAIGIICLAWGSGYSVLYSIRQGRSAPAITLQRHVVIMMSGLYVLCIPWSLHPSSRGVTLILTAGGFIYLVSLTIQVLLKLQD